MSRQSLPPEPDPETVERVSRYNFDELSRILTDRVGGDDAATRTSRPEPPRERPAPPVLVPKSPKPAQPGQGQLVNLAGETFILNRLPLGILVFRDQQVLFANRSITEMIGYGSVDELRSAGLAAIFPDAGSDAQAAGRSTTSSSATARWCRSPRGSSRSPGRASPR